MSASLWKNNATKFSAEQHQWLVMIRDHIVANLGIETDDVQDVLVSREAWTPGVTDVQDVLVSREAWTPGSTDFDYAPFAQEGGLGKGISYFVRS